MNNRLRENNSNWKGGKTHYGDGRNVIHIPDHPRASSKGYVYNTILIAESILGRYISNKIHIHHIDENKSNDEHNNLIICENKEFHLMLHRRMRAYKATRDANKRFCTFCKNWDSLNNLKGMNDKRKKNISQFFHLSCRKKYYRKRLYKISSNL